VALARQLVTREEEMNRQAVAESQELPDVVSAKRHGSETLLDNSAIQVMSTAL